MSKTKFIEAVEALFATNQVDAEASEYFNNTVKSKRVDKKAAEKSKVVKAAILAFLQESPAVEMEGGATQRQSFDRTEIADALYARGEFEEEFLLNEKGAIAYNSITAYANQLVAAGAILKSEHRQGKTKKVKYSI